MIPTAKCGRGGDSRCRPLLAQDFVEQDACGQQGAEEQDVAGRFAEADVQFFAVVDAWPWAQASLLAVAAGITWHILSFATLRR